MIVSGGDGKTAVATSLELDLGLYRKRDGNHLDDTFVETLGFINGIGT